MTSEEVHKKRAILYRKMEDNEDERRWLKKQTDGLEKLCLADCQQNERLCTLFSTGELADFFQESHHQQQQYHAQINESLDERQEEEIAVYLEEKRNQQKSEDISYG